MQRLEWRSRAAAAPRSVVVHNSRVSSPWTPSSRWLRPRSAALRLSLPGAGFARLPRWGREDPSPDPFPIDAAYAARSTDRVPKPCVHETGVDQLCIRCPVLTLVRTMRNLRSGRIKCRTAPGGASLPRSPYAAMHARNRQVAAKARQPAPIASAEVSDERSR